MCMRKISFVLVVLMAFSLFACAGSNGDNSLPDESLTPSDVQSSETSYDEGKIADLIAKYSHLGSATEKCVVLESKTVADGRAIISGYCEEGSDIYLAEGGNVTQVIKSHKGTYIIEINFAKGEKRKELEIYAKTEGKGVSEPVSAALRYSASAEGEFQHYVRVGKEGWLFFTNTEPQYTNNEHLAENRKNRITSRIRDRVSTLAEIGTKIIYVFIPNPNEVYSEYMPDEVEKGSVILREEVAKALSDAGATVIDMGETLKGLKGGEFEVYHRTDSHWTEYAAYFAYKALCDKFVSDGFTGAAPRDISEFNFTNEFRAAGDLYFDLGLDEYEFKVYSTFSDISFDAPVNLPKYAANDRSRINDDCMKEMTFHNANGSNKPSFIMMRDSYSIMLFDWLAERASDSYFKKLWDFDFDINEITTLGVDYIIYFVTDLNLNNVLK